MRSLWRTWVDAKTKDKSLRVFKEFRRYLGVEPQKQSIEPYTKTDGFVVDFEVELRSTAWSDCVCEVIEMGQRVGYDWTITGDVRYDPSGWSNKARISGIRAIEWTLIGQLAADGMT